MFFFNEMCVNFGRCLLLLHLRKDIHTQYNEKEERKRKRKVDKNCQELMCNVENQNCVSDLIVTICVIVWSFL